MDAFERQPVVPDQNDVVHNGEQDGQDDASRGNLGQAHADVGQAVFADFLVQEVDGAQKDAAHDDGTESAQQAFESG